MVAEPYLAWSGFLDMVLKDAVKILMKMLHL